jgi:hypothetical protein
MKNKFCRTLAWGFGVVIAAAWVHLSNGAAAEAAGLTVLPRLDQGEVEIRYKDQRILLYACRAGLFKPYVKELAPLGGPNLLLDAPPDHLHHHGIMYAITVNGHNFWEEAKAPGRQIPAGPPVHSVGMGPAGQPQAVLTQQLYWVPHTNASAPDPKAVALLIEQRTLTLSVDEANQEVALEWRGDFQLGPAATKVVLSGADYHGLGVRFIRAWDRTATHLNSDNLPYPTRGKHDVLQAQWAAVTHQWDGHQATLAVLARPGEMRGPTRFFSMLDGFCYLSATQGLDQAPLTYEAGARFFVRYLVLVYPKIQSHAWLQQRYRAWLNP